jgi:hypothetical protein
MEKYRKTIKQRIGFAALYCAAVLAVIGLGLFRPGDAHVSDYIAGMSLGMCLGIAFVAIFYMVMMANGSRSSTSARRTSGSC